MKRTIIVSTNDREFTRKVIDDNYDVTMHFTNEEESRIAMLLIDFISEVQEIITEHIEEEAK